MKSIIVATNFSHASHSAMRFIAEALTGKEYRIILFNFFSISVHALNARLSIDEIDRINKIRTDQLTLVAKRLATDFGIETITYFASGLFLKELNKCKIRYGAELVVTGMANKNLIQDIMGNTATMLISRLKCPILSVPINAKFNGIGTILFACDIFRGVEKKIFENIRKLAENFGSEVKLFRIRQSAEELLLPYMQDKIKQNFFDLKHKNTDVFADVIVKAIEQEIEIVKADILIMIPLRYSFWNSFINRSKTREMANSARIPLISITI